MLSKICEVGILHTNARERGNPLQTALSQVPESEKALHDSLNNARFRTTQVMHPSGRHTPRKRSSSARRNSVIAD